ncbi:MAG: hypothetical protein H8E28_14425 [Anaerolineae bacterium]|nr:hypothetical protein [Anaerolineae bacterium]
MKAHQTFPDREVTEKIIAAFTREALPRARKKGAIKHDEQVRILRDELSAAGFHVYQPGKPGMTNRAKRIGTYKIDLVVDHTYAIIVKFTKTVPYSHRIRLKGALQSMELPTGFIFNFGYSEKIIYRVDVEDPKGAD